MLDEMKKTFTSYADFIPNWKQLSKTELCNLYIQNENDEFLKNSYLSAIILNYWNKIYSLQSKTYLTASYQDAYDWVIEGIMYALKHRRWLDVDSSIYNDPNGPDKAINRKIKCIRLNFLASQNRDKRKLHINLLSLDSLEDGENLVGEQSYDIDIYSEQIKKLFDQGYQVEAILLDLILNEDCFVKQSSSEIVFDANKLSNIILNLPNDYVNYFSSQYGVNSSYVRKALDSTVINYIVKDLWSFGDQVVLKDKKQINKLINKIISKLKKNQEIINLVC